MHVELHVFTFHWKQTSCQMHVLITIRATLVTVTISGHAILSASTFQNNVGAQITCGDNQILPV